MKGLLSIAGSDYRYVYQVRPLDCPSAHGVLHMGGSDAYLLPLPPSHPWLAPDNLTMAHAYPRARTPSLSEPSPLHMLAPPLIALASSLRSAQGVHTIFEGTPDRKWHEGEKRVCKMVFIGRELDREAFKEAFEHCLVGEHVIRLV